MIWKWFKDKLFAAKPKNGVSNPEIILPVIPRGHGDHVPTSGVDWSKDELLVRVSRLQNNKVRADRVEWTCRCMNRAVELNDEALALSLIDPLLHDVLEEPGWFHSANLAFAVCDQCIARDLLTKANFRARAASALRQRMPANPNNLYYLVLGHLTEGHSMTPALSQDQLVYWDLIAGRITEEQVRVFLG